jgi:hypothetical protein
MRGLWEMFLSAGQRMAYQMAKNPARLWAVFDSLWRSKSSKKNKKVLPKAGKSAFWQYIFYIN